MNILSSFVHEIQTDEKTLGRKWNRYKFLIKMSVKIELGIETVHEFSVHDCEFDGREGGEEKERQSEVFSLNVRTVDRNPVIL